MHSCLGGKFCWKGAQLQHLEFSKLKEREGEKDGRKERNREKKRQRGRQEDREGERDRLRPRYTERKREKDGHTDRQTDRQTDRDREREGTPDQSKLSRWRGYYFHSFPRMSIKSRNLSVSETEDSSLVAVFLALFVSQQKMSWECLSALYLGTRLTT